jgi:hypothetical protein
VTVEVTEKNTHHRIGPQFYFKIFLFSLYSITGHRKVLILNTMNRKRKLLQKK